MPLAPAPDPVSPALITTLGPSAHRSRLRIGARVALAVPLLVALGACTQVANFVAKPEPKPKGDAEAEPKVAAKPAAPAEVESAPIPKPQEKPKPGKLYEWDGGDRKLTRIIVNTDEQKARFYVGDDQVGWTTVASGLSSHPTPVGHFEVLEKSANKRSNLYGKVLGKGGRVLSTNAKAGHDQFPSGARFEGASMPYYLRITYDGVGLHAGPIPHPGHPASHGCIRLPAKLAPVLFEHVGVGTQVSVVGSGPDYGNYDAKQRAYAAQQLAKAQGRKDVEARTRAEASAASGAPAVTTRPAEPVIAMAEPTELTERPEPTPVANAAPHPAAASRMLETPRERAPVAAPAPRRTAEATVARPRPAATRPRPARAASQATAPAVALADNTPSQKAGPVADAPSQDQAQAVTPEVAATPVAAVQAPAAPTTQPAPAKAEPLQASPPAVAVAPTSPPPAPAAPAPKGAEPIAKSPQVAAEAPAEPAAAPEPAQPPASTGDKAAGG